MAVWKKLSYPVVFRYLDDDSGPPTNEKGKLYREETNDYDGPLMDHSVDVIMSYHNKADRLEAFRRIFARGVESMMMDKELEGHPGAKAFAVHKKAREIAVRKALHRNLEYVYENQTPEEFAKFCEENRVDMDEFKKNYLVVETSTYSWNITALEWLTKELSDGQEHETSDIMQAAQNAEVIKDPKDWTNLKLIASRHGFSSRELRGKWKLKAKAD